MVPEGVVHASRRERARLAEIVPLAGDHVSNLAARVVHVAAVSRDHMHVQVHDRLPRRRARVEPDVVPIGGELRVELRLHVARELQESPLLLDGSVKPRRYCSPWDHERVPLGHRVFVADRERHGSSLGFGVHCLEELS